MALRILAIHLTLLCALGVSGAMAVEGNPTLALGPLTDTVREARSEGLSPTEAVEQLISAGSAPAKAAYAVASVWNECQATREAVAVAVRAAGDAVEPVMTIMGGLRGCGCSAQSSWARVRQDTRLRPTPFTTIPIELSSACACVTAAVEAAIMAVPEKADRIVRAAVEASQAVAPPLDSVGRRQEDIALLFADPPAEPAIYARRAAACTTDRDSFDAFDTNERWERRPFGTYGGIGRFAPACGAEAAAALLLTEFSAGPGVASYVELYNGTRSTIELSADDYRLSQYHRGLGRRGTSIALLGVIPPGGTFVVADSRAEDRVLRRANLLVPELRFQPGDALVLHQGWGAENCRCSEAIVAASLRAPATTGARDPAQAGMVHGKLSRIYGLVPGIAPGQVVDAIGQVDWDPRFTGGAPLLDRRLRRLPEACSGESNELDPFLEDGAFERSDEPDFRDAGAHRADCRTPQTDLVVSEFIAGDRTMEIIELHNPTPADIDLGGGGYLLELYGPGDQTPFRVIELRGNVEGDGSFLIATPQALRALGREADLTVSSLDASMSSAVVLKKLNMASPQRCTQNVAAALELYFEGDLAFVESPGDPGIKPTPPPPSVDPIPSPN